MNIKELKNIVEKRTEDFINVCNNFKYKYGGIKSLESSQYINDKDLKNIKDRFEDILSSLEKDIYHLTKNLYDFKRFDWKNLNIAFFGETGAGKSTLIEALIKGDGRSIGDGTKDFTKTYKFYKYDNIVNLIDIPGIEGLEKEVRDSIKSALSRTHIIFFVFANKEPEEGTLKKLKSYLNNHAYIYGILNIKERIKDKKELKERFNSRKINTIIIRSERKLKAIFGSKFIKIIKVHALYAFYSRAKGFKPFNKKATKWVSEEKAKEIIDLFEGRKELLKISNLNELILIIEELKNGFHERIVWSNVRKILNKQEIIIHKILRSKKELDRFIFNLKENFKKLRIKYLIEKKLLKQNIYKIVSLYSEEMKVEIKKEVGKLIDKGIDNQYEYNKVLKKTIDKYSKTIDKEIKKEISEFKRKIKQELEIFKNKLDYLEKLFGDSITFDFKEIVRKIKYTLNDFIEDIKDTISKIIIVILFIKEPIISAIAGIVILLSKIIDWLFFRSEEKKLKAKQEAYQRIDIEFKKIKENANKTIKKEFKEIDRRFQEIESKLKSEEENIKHISEIIGNIANNLISIHHDISQNFVKYLDKDIKFAYIQTTIKNKKAYEDYICVLGGNHNILSEKLRICGIKHFYLYKSLQEFYYSINNENNEFFKRLKNFVQYHKKKVIEHSNTTIFL